MRTLLCWVPASLTLLLAAPAGAAPSDTDALLQARIQSARLQANRVRIDGDGKDWDGFPAFTFPASKRPEDAAREVVRVAQAGREHDILVCVTTAGKPVADPFTYWIALNFTGYLYAMDVLLQLNPDSRHPSRLVIYEPGKVPVTRDFPTVTERIGTCVEVQVDYDMLARALPASMAAFLSPAKRQRTVSVAVMTWDCRTNKIISQTGRRNNYCVFADPYPLDPPLPRPSVSPIPTEVPIDGQWLISQGPFHAGSTHAGIWAYDLTKTDVNGEWRKDPAGVPSNDNYYAWGQAVHSPIDGQAEYTITNVPDRAPSQSGMPLHCSTNEPANAVFIGPGGRVLMTLGHLQQGSTPFAATWANPHPVKHGDFLGLVGNSGCSPGPHLHIDFYDAWNGRTLVTYPMLLTNVRVSLNPIPDDPWCRDLTAWEPREGFYVENLPSP